MTGLHLPTQSEILRGAAIRARRSRLNMLPPPKPKPSPKVEAPLIVDAPLPSVPSVVIPPALPLFVVDIEPKAKIINDPKFSRRVKKAVSAEFGISVDIMTSSKRTAAVVLARHVAMWLMLEIGKFSLPKVGRLFGGKDHTTVLHAKRRIARDLEIKPDLADRVLKVRQQLDVMQATDDKAPPPIAWLGA